jgi:cob(I)alamin adenosyltransferase
MKIYTKTGDAGQTGLIGGDRVDKNDDRLDAYGTADELNACIGLIRAQKIDADSDNTLNTIQSLLFDIGSILATPADKREKFGMGAFPAEKATILEESIDKMQNELSELRNFILPGGSPAAAHTHLARTVTRRLERSLVALNHHTPVDNGIIVFINRLSDYFFVLARYFNKMSDTDETIWQKA